MKTIELKIKLRFDDKLMYNDKDSKDWFYNDILSDKYNQLFLHSEEIGDVIGKVKIIKEK